MKLQQVLCSSFFLLLETAGLAVRMPASMPPSRPRTYSNPTGLTLTPIRENVWLAERPFFPRLPGLTGTDVACKMGVVRLPDGALWIHSPVQIDGALIEALAELGPVKHIVTPNTEHQKFAPEWVLQYPEAISYACPTLRQKKPGVWQKTIGIKDGKGDVWSDETPPAWQNVIRVCWLDGERELPLLGRFFNEVVFAHEPSGVLFVTDLWWNYPASSDDIQGGLGPEGRVPDASRRWKAVMDKVYKPIYNGLLKTTEAQTRLDLILSWSWDYIAPCHGEPIETDAKVILARHLGQ